jgi:hypothetical protein
MSDQSQDEGTAEDPGEQELSPEQEQMLRQMEEEMRRIRVQDLLAQSVVSILNLSYRRIAKEDERDLEQAKLGIDAIRALVDMLEPEAQHEVKNALSQIQLAYAQLAGPSAAGEGSPPGPGGVGGGQPGPGGSEPGGVRKPPPGLWTPGSG